MQKIIPHLWYNTEAKDAAKFYTSIFPNSKITSEAVIENTPSGNCDFVGFSIMGYEIMALSGGPFFKLNPSISLMVNFDPSQDKDARKNIDEIWDKLIEGGKVLMPIDKYPFSERYGWVQDKFGMTWQLILTNPAGQPRPPILPAMLFVGPAYGKAEAATDFYLSVFKNAKRGGMTKYPAGMEPNKEGTVMFTDVQLEGQWFAAMDGGGAHKFVFNEALSFIINCDTQKEIDYYWEKLSAVPEAEQCGWLKDKFGVSWQVTPSLMQEVLACKEQKKINRVVQSFLEMKKFDIAKLKKAYEG